MNEPSKHLNVETACPELVEGLKRLNVLLIVSSYLPNRGGLQTVTSQLAAGLQKHGVDVAVLAQRHPRTLAAVENIDGVPVQRLLFLTPRLRDVRRGRFDLFLASLFFFPLTLARLIWRIAREKPDGVFLHFVGAPTLFVLIARWLIHFHFVVSLHGDDVEGLPRGDAFDRWLFRATVQRADAVTACSRYLLDQAIAIEPSIAPKARVIYNGISIAENPAQIPGDAILAVGRFVPKKGLDVLLRALALGNRAMRLHLIGDGPERDALESLARELNLQDRVVFLGAQDHAFVAHAMRSSRLVVVPSRGDTFGLVALEAMAAGKPVIASRVGGLPEILQDADAMLVEPDDPAMLADAIQQMLDRLEREPEFGARNREIAARFSLERMTDEYLGLY